MNIAFDATAIRGSKDRGIGKYTANQFDAMIASSPSDHFFYFNYYHSPHVGIYLKPSPNLHEVMIYCGPAANLCVNKNHQDLFGAILRGYLEKYHIDVFYITSPFDFVNGPSYRKEWFGSVKTCATFYDSIPRVFEHIYLTDPNTKTMYAEREEMLQFMDHIFAISDSAGSDLCRFSAYPPEQVTVIWGAPDARFKPIRYPEEEVFSLKDKFHITSPYILSVAGDDDRKNIDGLIRAFSLLPKEITDHYQLVITCKMRDFRIKEYCAIAEEHGIPGRVVFTNFVTDDELLRLYNAASLSAFVSKYEGFGLPVVESYACGLPVVTSNNSSLGEVGRNAAILVDPFDDEDIAAGLKHALTMTDAERIERQKQADELLKIYDWNVSARVIMSALYSMQGNVKKSKRIAFFTPLPPMESGIADFSVDVLNEIAQYYSQIDVFIDKGYVPSCELAENIRVYLYTQYRQELYDETVYQMGNSTFHTYMLDMIKRYPGIVELHDTNLHGLLQALSLHIEKSWEQYKEYLLEDVSEEEANRQIQNVQNGDFDISKLILNGVVTNYAKKIIVHSEYARQKLLERDCSKNVVCIPLYGNVERMIDGRAYRSEHGFHFEDTVIGAFGAVHFTKRNIPALYACQKLWREGFHFKFVLVGKVLDPNDQKSIDRLCEDENIRKNLIVTGFTELDVFLKYMRAVDIGLNLRYPYNGENSASSARLMSLGKCVLINNIGSFAEIDDDACIKLPNVADMSEKEEIQAIYSSLKDLLQHPQKAAQIGRKAFAYAKREFDLPAVGEKYYRLLDSKQEFFITPDQIRAFSQDIMITASVDEMQLLSETLSKAKLS